MWVVGGAAVVGAIVMWKLQAKHRERQRAQLVEVERLRNEEALRAQRAEQQAQQAARQEQAQRQHAEQAQRTVQAEKARAVKAETELKQVQTNLSVAEKTVSELVAKLAAGNPQEPLLGSPA
jgi:Flp pilus assembly protein TadB